MDKLVKELEGIIEEQTKLLDALGEDHHDIEFYANKGGFTNGDICNFLNLVKKFDDLINSGVEFSHCLITYRGTRFLFYNASLKIKKLKVQDPHVMTLRKASSPETIEYQAGIVPLAIPTKCNSGHTLVTAPNGNKVCPYGTHGSDYWYCTKCGKIKTSVDITHVPSGGHSQTCTCTSTSCGKIKGLY